MKLNRTVDLHTSITRLEFSPLWNRLDCDRKIVLFRRLLDVLFGK